VVLSKCRRNQGPKHANIPVTNLPETVTAREVVALGQHQVTKQPERVGRSVAVAIMAYLLLLKLRARDVPPDRPWSVFRLQRAFAWEVVQAQGERSARQMARKWLQLGKVA
jgi:hypothetical protein